MVKFNWYENKRILINSQLKTFDVKLWWLLEKNLSHLQWTINDCIIMHVTQSKIDTKSWDVVFVYVYCLRENSVNPWEQNRDIELPTWKEMNDFLTTRYQTLKLYKISNRTEVRYSKSRSFMQSKSPRKKLNAYSTKVTDSAHNKYIMWEQVHPLRLCPTFLKFTSEKCIATSKRHRRCLNFFASSHGVKTCTSTSSCYICKRKRHSLLHRMDYRQQHTLRTSDAPQRRTPAVENSNNYLSHNSNA